MKRLSFFTLTAFFGLFLTVQGISGQMPGSFDESFGAGGKVISTFLSIDQATASVRQPDGKLIVAGIVKAKVASTVAFGVVRLNADGSLDSSFSGDGKLVLPIGFVSRAYSVALQSDGKILVAGSTNSGFDERFAVARINSDGSLDTTFNNTGQVVVTSLERAAYSVLAQPDGKIVLVGTSSNDFGLARLNSNGSLDTTFGSEGIIRTQVGPGNSFDIANAGLLQTDGKIVVVGNTMTGINSHEMAVVRYNTDGSLDNSFDEDGKVLIPHNVPYSIGNAVVQQSDGKLVVGGKSFDLETSNTNFTLARLNINGSLDTNFGEGGKVTTSTSPVTSGEDLYALTVQPDGKLLAAGYSTSNTNGYDFALIRYNSDGSLDNSFDGDGILITPTAPGEDRARSVIASPDGKIFAVGFRAEATSGQYEFAVLKLNSDGSRDSSFSSDGLVSFWVGEDDFADEQINALAVQPDGKIIAVGVAGNAFAVARYNQNGSLDPTFDGDGRLVLSPLPNINDQGRGSANAAVVQPDGKILVAGTVANTASGRNVIVVARFLSDGTPDPSFDGDGKLITGSSTWSGDGRGIALQSDGKIVVSGAATLNMTKTNFVLARYNSDGSLDSSFDADGIVTTAIGTGFDASFAVTLQSDGKIVAGGTSSTAPNGIPQFAAVRYNSNGSLDTSFDGDGKFVLGAGLYAYSIAVQPDQKIILGGSGGSAFSALRLNPNGSIDTNFGQAGVATTSVGFNSDGRSMALQRDGKIVLAGFSRPSNVTDHDFTLVRYTSGGILDSTFDGDGVLTTSLTQSTDEAYAVTIDKRGKIIAAGKAFTSDTKDDFALARYNSGLSPNSLNPIFDFDGDGKSDIGIFRPNVGQWWINQSSNNQTFAAAFGASTDRITPADFTGDGKSDLAFFRPSTGFWFILRSEDFSFYGFNFGASGDVPIAADFDGDGKADQAVFRPSNSGWYIQKSSGGIESLTFGLNGDSPVVADYDGDGKADIAITRINNGNREWWIRRSSDNQIFSVTFGDSADKAVQGDYTGDGKADIAFFRPSNSTWYVLRSEDYSFYGFPFGATNDTPTVGDFDGDGKMDAAVYRQSNNGWYQLRSTQGFTAITFGTAGDIPVHTAFLP